MTAYVASRAPKPSPPLRPIQSRRTSAPVSRKSTAPKTIALDRAMITSRDQRPPPVVLRAFERRPAEDCWRDGLLEVGMA
jgi:hypothetical protein